MHCGSYLGVPYVACQIHETTVSHVTELYRQVGLESVTGLPFSYQVAIGNTALALECIAARMFMYT